jgi:hypothetical protein
MWTWYCISGEFLLAATAQDLEKLEKFIKERSPIKPIA